MAKRFHDTEIWEEDWFIALPRDYRDLWLYVKDNCDYAGVWRPNVTRFNKLYDCSANLKDAIRLFNKDKERVVVLKNEKWFLTQFIPFQYGGTLNQKNHFHAGIITLLKQNEVNLRLIRPQVEVNLSPTCPHLEDSPGPKVKDKVMVKDKVLNAFINQFFEYFIIKTNKNIKLTMDRRAIIEKRYHEGRTLEELKRAVDNFVSDDWQDRHKFVDIIYCIGVRNKVDNLDKWLNFKAKPGRIEPKPKAGCDVCGGTGKVLEGTQKGVHCFCY